jgi:thioredoxin 1
MAKELTSKIFKKEVLDSKEPVMVDFFASWCGPCKMMSPIVDELAKEMEKVIKIFKVSIEEDEALASEYGVMSIPTFLFFKNGKVVDQAGGAMTKDALVKVIKKAIK